MADFKKALSKVLKWETGYVNDSMMQVEKLCWSFKKEQ